MQASETRTAYQPPDLGQRVHFPYYAWMRGEGIPIHFEVAGVSDIIEVPRAPWARTGKGLGVFLELDGTYQAERGMFVCEIPAGQSLDVQHHLYEQFTLILQGSGTTEIWQNQAGPGPGGGNQGSGPLSAAGPARRTFEWGKGSLFAPPKNTYYRMHNLGSEPVLYFGVTTAPRLMNGMFPAGGGTGSGVTTTSQFEFVFNSDHDFPELYDGGEAYFARSDDRHVATVPPTKENGYGGNVWYTNFIPNVYEETVDPRNHKVAGGRVTGYRMAGGFPMGHLGEWPVGRYHKAHYHGPGAVLVGLKGHGYVNLWPHELGIHPWQDGHGDQVELVEWGVNSIYVPPDGYWHQHMSTGNVPARHVAVYGGSLPLMTRGRADGDGETDLSIPYSEGGRLLDYEDEDPEVRRYFIEANRKEGVECTMPPVTYRTLPQGR